MSLEKSDREKLYAFLDALGGQSRKGYFEIRCIPPDRQKGSQSKYYHTTQELLQQWPYIERMNAQGYLVSLGVGRRRFNGGKKRDDILQVNAVWVDLDGKDFFPENIEKGKELALQGLHQFKIPPSCIVDSGNGYHAYWFLREPVVIESSKEANV